MSDYVRFCCSLYLGLLQAWVLRFLCPWEMPCSTWPPQAAFIPPPALPVAL
jgi:hypothetical protein